MVAEKKKGMRVKSGSVFSVRKNLSDNIFSVFYYLVNCVLPNSREVVVNLIGHEVVHSSGHSYSLEEVSDKQKETINGRLVNHNELIIPRVDKFGNRRTLIDLSPENTEILSKISTFLPQNRSNK